MLGGSVREIIVYSTITVGADIIRPQPYRIDSTHIHRKCSKTGTFRADNIRPYGGNVRCLKTVNNNLPQNGMANQPFITIWRRA